MSPVDEILSQIPLRDLAAQLGTDEATAEQAARQALPALLGGMQANTDDPGGASSFARAVDQHSSSLIDGGVNLDEVDTDDGRKIVSHVFGANQDQVVNQLSLGGAGGSGLIGKLLPLLAPIVMSYLAKKLGGGTAAGGGEGSATCSADSSAVGAARRAVAGSVGVSATCSVVCSAAAPASSAVAAAGNVHPAA
ncbi:DUF937 domain-containing protein [Pseudonocardia benzenivorans]